MRLELKSVVKQYGQQRALDNLNIAIADTSCLALIGPSGGGKSTTLRLLAGLEAPTSGSIRINENEIGSDAAKRNAHLKNVGVVFQSYNLFPHLDALTNIALPLEKVHKHSKADSIAKAESLLQQFQLFEHRLKMPSQLSGGQNQRVAIARAIAPDPDIVFLDEPTSALDPEMTAEVLDAIESLVEAKKRLVIATHQMGFAKQAADTVAIIAGGKLVEVGDASQVIDQPSTERAREFLNACLKF